jgi:hypothetical protein
VTGRAEVARQIAAALVRRIAWQVPPGMGAWPPSWELTARPGDAFLDELRSFEAGSSIEPSEELTSHGEAVLAAWRDAAREWRKCGSPRIDR